MHRGRLLPKWFLHMLSTSSFQIYRYSRWFDIGWKFLQLIGITAWLFKNAGYKQTTIMILRYRTGWKYYNLNINLICSTTVCVFCVGLVSCESKSNVLLFYNLTHSCHCCCNYGNCGNAMITHNCCYTRCAIQTELHCTAVEFLMVNLNSMRHLQTLPEFILASSLCTADHK